MVIYPNKPKSSARIVILVEIYDFKMINTTVYIPSWTFLPWQTFLLILVLQPLLVV